MQTTPHDIALFNRYDTNAGKQRMTEQVFQEIWEKYSEPHRFYHNISHVTDLFDQIDQNQKAGHLNKEDVALSYAAALFHDVIYNPYQTDNEEKSCEYYKSVFGAAANPTVIQMILGTKSHKMDSPDFRLNVFNQMDMFSVFSPDFHETEINMFKEYQKYPLQEYRKGREDFLTGVKDALKNKTTDIAIDSHLYYIRKFKPKIGVFAGTFNQFHNGHMNILEKAETIFDKVIVLCAFNPAKTNDRASVIAQVRSVLPFHEVVLWDGLLMDYINQLEAYGCNATVVKGFRDSNDLVNELNNYKFMQDFHKNVKIAYIPCDRELEHISSSALRSISSFGPLVTKYIPTKFDYYHAEH